MTPHLSPIANRAADGTFTLREDGWVQLVPLGDYPHAESGKVQVCDSQALSSMANRYRADAARMGNRWPGLLIDQDHFSYDPQKSSEAMGWVDDVQTNTDGLWGKVRWTDAGAAAVKNGRYRFISPAWLPTDCVALDKDRVRPLRLDSAALTNTPNMRGMAPISNRTDSPAGTVPAVSTRKEPQPMKDIAKTLGLPDDATPEAVSAAVAELKTSNIALKNRVTELETERGTLLAAQVESDLARFANRIAPDKRDAVKAALLKNRADTLAVLEAVPEPTAATPPAPTARAPVTDPSKAKTPGDSDTSFPALVNRLASQGMTRSKALDQAMADRPDLYEAYRKTGGKF